MWSRNLVNTIQTVAQAVAPPVDSDEDEYDDEEYTDDDEEEEYSTSQHAYDNGPPQSGGALGFVGLLTRAMDRQEHAEDVEEEEYEAEEDLVVDEQQEPLATTTYYSSDEDDDSHHHDAAAAALEDDPGTPPPQMMSPQKRESGSVHAGLLKAAPEALQQLHLLDDDEDDDDSTDGRNDNDDHTEIAPVEEEKEVTSVSPTQQTNSVGRNGDLAPAADRLISEATTEHAIKTPTQSSDTKSSLPVSFKVPPKPSSAASPSHQHSITASRTEAQSNATPPERKFAQPPTPLPFKSPPPPAAIDNKTLQPSPVPVKKPLPTPPSPRLGLAEVTAPASQQQQHQQLEMRCRQLEEQLAQAQQELAIRNTSKADDLDVLAEQIRQQEANHLQQAQQAHQRELRTMTQQFEARIEQLERDMRQEQKTFEKERRQMATQLQNQADARRVEQEFAKQQEQLIQTMTLLDEREHQVLQLRQTIKNLEGLVQKNKATHMENEDILEEVHQENDQLRNHVEQAEARCVVLKGKVEELQHQQEKSAHVQLELRMLKEELERERAKGQNAVVSATSSNQKLEEDRDAALALVEDYKQRLAATAADLDIAQADYQRTLLSNTNLQSALESFQSEREAELGMLEEQRRESEQALTAAHTATVEAVKGAHAEQLRQVQAAADAALRNSMQEIQQLEGQLKKYESENIQMRRSLDEAIHRLQMNQEDVIDRTLMKNILMDWLTKTGVKERKDILELMASVLHFSEDEKERVHISSSHIATSLLGKLTGPAPPPKADMENLQGDTVSEKWVSFLLAESDD